MKSLTLGFLHWSLQRTSAVCLIALSCGSLVANSTYVSSLILIILTFHFKLGIETLLEDYVHDTKLKLFGFTLLRIIFVFFIKGIILFYLI